MNKRILPALWGCLFIICAGLGFIPQPGIAGKVLGLCFFVPPAALLWRGEQVTLVRNLSALSLGLTAVLLVANFLTVFVSAFWGTVLHYMLAIVSAPMLAMGHWAMSMFLWACLLFAALRKTK